MSPLSSSLPASYSFSKREKNDVFVNYSYEDIGKSFISHLQGELRRNGYIISDHKKLTVGQDVCSELLKAIEESRIYVPVFSPHYASYVSCLNELADIMDCKDKFYHKIVFPVFYKVSPRDVRNQKGPFKEAFNGHTTNLDDHKVQKWRQALAKAGQLAGEHYTNGYEESFICKIVKKLQIIQNQQELYVTDHPVGIDSRVKELSSSLRLDSKDVSVVAVWGIGGIGKTTIVKALYNRIAAEFYASCFLEVGSYDSWSQTSKVEMQKLLISSLSKYDNLPVIHNEFEGIAKIRNLASNRKVLLILDDVTHVDQLKAFGINPNHTSSLNTCFGGGSRIIVTTRDKRLLGSLSDVFYNPRLLSITESIELLTPFLYEKNDPSIDMKFLKEVADCASGLPLVLEVWSRHFKCHKRREDWPDVLKDLKANPHPDVQQKLQISYNALTNRAKKLFLDIACFFYGMEKKLIVEVLQEEESAFFLDQDIQCLADRGLVTITTSLKCSTVSMHNAIMEMGQEIVRQENEDKPGHRTRLTNHKDVHCVLEESKGTQSVESICQGKMTADIMAFRKMNNLRLIRLDDVSLRYGRKRFLDVAYMGKPLLSFPKLKYLEWEGFPMKSINIDMCNVVVVRLHSSCLETLWNGYKGLEKLKILDVSYSRFLTKTGSFEGLKSLEYLHFNGCEKLEELDRSVHFLDKLVKLDLNGCKRLKRFPWEMIGKLRSLEELDLTGCVRIGFKHDDVIIPFLSSLKETHITRLMLNSCKIYNVPREVGSLTLLKHLDLGRNKFHSLPDSLGQLDQLETIDLSDCRSIQSNSDLLQSAGSITVRSFHSLTTLPSNMSELISLRELQLNKSKCLTTLLSGLSVSTSLKELDLRGCSKLGIEDQCLMKLTKLSSLTKLNMEDCNISDVPSEIGNLVSLRELDLSRNTFSSLPDSFSNLPQLRDLVIRDCSELTSLPLLPPSLTKIEATGCLSLDVMRSTSLVVDEFCCCPTPSRNRDQYYHYEFSKCILAVYKEVSFISRLQIMLSDDEDEVEVPNWCHYQDRGDVLSFMAPQDRKIFGMIVCLRYRPSHDEIQLVAKLQNKTKGTSYCLSPADWIRGMMCVMFVPLDKTTLMVEAGDELAIDFHIDDKRFSGGLCLIYKGEGDEMEPKRLSTRPNLKG